MSSFGLHVSQGFNGPWQQNSFLLPESTCCILLTPAQQQHAQTGHREPGGPFQRVGLARGHILYARMVDRDRQDIPSHQEDPPDDGKIVEGCVCTAVSSASWVEVDRKHHLFSLIIYVAIIRLD